MEQTKIKAFLTKRMLIPTAVIYTFYSLILTPLYIKSETDIVFMIPILIDVLPFLLDITEIVGLLFMYTATILALRYSRNGKIVFIRTAFPLITFMKYILQLPVLLLLGNPLPGKKDFLTSFVLPFSLEIVQYVIFNLIVYGIMKKTFSFIDGKIKLQHLLPDCKFDPDTVFFPFDHLFNKTNPLQRSAYFAGVIITVSKMLQLLVIDITTGLPQSIGELIIIAAYYTGCMILGVCSYLFIVFVIIKFEYSVANKKQSP